MSDSTNDTPEEGSASFPQLGGVLDASSGSDVPCMLLPLSSGNLLVPTVTVAEMMPIQPFDIKPNTPDWFLGFFPWRNTRVPVVSYETMNLLSSPKLSARGRVAVLNHTGAADDVPFVGMLTQDIPRMARVEEADITEDEEATRHPYDMMTVKVGVEPLVIPNIEAIERAVSDLDLARF